MVRFKVRPRRDAVPPPCAAELSALLACFATRGVGALRSTSTGECATAADALYGCMKGRGKGGRPGKSSINHLLGKVSGGR